MSRPLGPQEIEALIKVIRTVGTHLDLNTVLDSIISVTTEVMQAEAASLVLVDETTGELIFHIAQGEKAGALKTMRMKPGEGIVGWVVDNNKPETVNDVSNDPRFAGRVDDTSGFTTRSILCVPLRTTKRKWGAIEVLNRLDGRGFNEHDLTLCETIAGQAAIAVENAWLHENIVKNEKMAAIGQTVAGMAHCIKNVLNGIHGGAFMVDHCLGKNDLDGLNKGWEIVKRNNVFLKDLVLDMLTYAKEREPELMPCNVHELLESVCKLSSAESERRGVAVECRPTEDIKEVMLDERGIKRCLLNLVGNATDASEGRPEPRVILQARKTNENTLCISVSDNGCGIAEEDTAKLFQVFFSTKGSKGTGLGLAVTHKIVSEHGGRIDVKSAIDQGTTFSIYLPMRHDDDN